MLLGVTPVSIVCEYLMDTVSSELLVRPCSQLVIIAVTLRLVVLRFVRQEFVSATVISLVIVFAVVCVILQAYCS